MFLKNEVEIPGFAQMEADFPYMEILANFNFIFLKNDIWKLFNAQGYS